MRPRTKVGASPLRLAIWPAIVLLASGAAPVAARAVDDGSQTPFRTHASVFQVAPQFEVRPSCPVITVSPDGVCALPANPAQLWTKRATIFLCSESLCGSGFPAGSTILLLATRAGGSTFWRTVADGTGNFRSALPAPLCRFAPVGLTAFDNRAGRSIRISLASTGCARAMP
jgi:hypothetical protein